MSLGAIVQVVNAPASVNLGSPFSATVRVSNTGTEVLRPGQDNLGSVLPQDNQRWGTNRIALTSPLNPGQFQDITRSFTPTIAGSSLQFAWQAVREGVAWFGQAGSSAITVVEPPRVVPGPRADAQDLVGNQIFNTGAVPADRQQRSLSWRNPGPKRMLISAAELWAGVDKGGICDLHAQVTRSDGSMMVILQWDHYADPTAPVTKAQAFSPYMALEPGESLNLLYFANPFPGPFSVHITATFWWRYA